MRSILVLDPEYQFADISKAVGGKSKAIVWPGMGAKNIAMHYVYMEPNQSNIPHTHTDSEDVIYVIKGEGTVLNDDTGEELPYRKGNVIYIPAGVSHAVQANGNAGFIGIGAQAPFDMDFYKRAGLI